MSTESRTHTVVIYSDDARVRDAVQLAVGVRPASDLGRVSYVECRSNLEILGAIDAGGIDLVVLDGEARPTGGMGIAKQLKDEIDDCPPTLVLVARQGDTWLANWALADGVEPLPVDPITLAPAVAALLRHREANLPVRRAAAV